MFKHLFVLFIVLSFIVGCSEEETSLKQSCGDGVCDSIEKNLGKCSVDCAANIPKESSPSENESSLPEEAFSPVSAGDSFITYIPSEGIGNIAVQVTLPNVPRYDTGAPLLIHISTFFTPSAPVFDTSFTDVTSLGFVHVTYLWPGKSDPSGVFSEGTYDYGGEDSLQALRDIILFTGGQIPDYQGHYISEWTTVSLQTDNVGLYAFSHPGIAATNVLAYYPTQLSFVSYFVGRENPTSDVLYPLEPGYWADDGAAVYNPYYTYPDDYSSTALAIDYSAVQWSQEEDVPYMDDNGNGVYDAGEFLYGTKRPTMYDKIFYSRTLTSALEENNAFAETGWPADLATVADTEALWPLRETVFNYDTFPHNTHVLLVFSLRDHVQTALDKPHIHQAYDGFSTNGVWVRLNPDQSYVSSLDASLGASSPDNDANTEPSDWSTIGLWSHPSLSFATVFVPLAAVAEMADRTYRDTWDENLDAILVEYDAGDLS